MLDEEGDGTKIDYELFKHKYFINDEMKDFSEEIWFKEGVSEKQVILDRLKQLDLTLQKKFQNNWTSLRKAFLDLDVDYDGFITTEDIIWEFGKGINYKDLKTLVINKDEKREAKINFKDFCKWMGSVIEPTENFYFWHDSKVNIDYETAT